MTSPLRVMASVALLYAGFEANARTHEAPVDPSKGAKLTSRIPCDGETNPEDQLVLQPTFSAGGMERAFRIELFEKDYCKRVDLGFKCLQPAHNRWKQEWRVESAQAAGRSAPGESVVRDSQSPNPQRGYIGLASCATWGSKDPADYVLTGWYRESPSKKAGKKALWKQAEIKRASSSMESYEFADPSGGTARLEIVRP
jgi:hypothetical protein